MWLANRCRLEHEYQGKLIIPLQPNISMHILQAVLYTFPEVLTGRICSKSVKFTKVSQTIDEVYGVNSRVTTKAPPNFTNITKFTMIGHFRCLVVQ